MATVLHVDLDAFFVSCELLRRPELRGRPVVVAGGRESHPGEPRRPGRAVVAAASYEARAFGVRSALPLARALSLCPALTSLPVDIAHYAQISRQVFALFEQVTPLVEPGSLDEAYLDVSGSLQGGGEQIARALQERLDRELGLPASVGVATSKVVAKIASDLRKPRGLVVVAAGREAGFLAPLAVARLPGAGPKTVERLRLLGIETLGELAAVPADRLAAAGISNPLQLRLRALGIDHSRVEIPGPPKSISREETYASDLTELEPMERRLRLLAAAVGERLRRSHLLAGAISLKLRLDDFETLVRRRRLPEPTAADQLLAAAVIELHRQSWPRGRPVRLLGVGAESLLPDGQLGLFDQPREPSRVDRALDAVRLRYGADAIVRGTDSLDAPRDWNRDHLPGAGR